LIEVPITAALIVLLLIERALNPRRTRNSRGHRRI
jgi:hypothetical protein